ncbi:MAG: hypothetical protein KUG75_10300 [Pseudomonadales bacterium]|nr:hypothetical protein [Pseudomonadales bacterium]
MRIKKKAIKLYLALVLCVFSLNNLAAPVLNYDSGQLIGASNVLVDGTFYNVEFIEGSCISVFSGCNESSDFAFNTWPTVQSALHALLDQVFIGPLENNPSLVLGCESNSACFMATPYASVLGGTFALLGMAITTKWDDVEGVIWAVLPGSYDVDTNSHKVYAKWTQVVPIPAALWLFASALFGLCLTARKSARKR